MSRTSKLPFGTALALAQRTLSAPLAAVLDGENLAMRDWFTLNALGLRGSTRMEVLAGLLATNGLDAQGARDLVMAMDHAGLVEVHDDEVALTPEGAARYTHMRDRIAQLNTRIFGQFNAERVEIARELLQEIADMDPQELTRRSMQTG